MNRHTQKCQKLQNQYCCYCYHCFYCFLSEFKFLDKTVSNSFWRCEKPGEGLCHEFTLQCSVIEESNLSHCAIYEPGKLKRGRNKDTWKYIVIVCVCVHVILNHICELYSCINWTKMHIQIYMYIHICMTVIYIYTQLILVTWNTMFNKVTINTELPSTGPLLLGQIQVQAPVNLLSHFHQLINI